MKKLLVGAAALLTSLTGVMASAPADAAWGGQGPGGGYHSSATYRGGGYHAGGYGYRGGGYGYHGGYGGGWGWGLGGLAAGIAVGSALAAPYYAAPYYAGPYVGPDYYGWYGGCRREWVWTGYGYRMVRACY
jgi:hypothetical protein